MKYHEAQQFNLPLIAQDIPLPAVSERRLLRETISKLKPGESFLWGKDKHFYSEAKKLGIKIVARKQNGTGWRVWRILP